MSGQTSSHIEAIEIDQAGHLLVRLDGRRSFELIYRLANGLSWDPAKHAIQAAQPDRWEHRELLSHICASLASEYGEHWETGSSTLWINVPAELQRRLTDLPT